MEDHEIKKAIAEGIREAFAVGEENKRFIDVNRIPLICQTIVQMADDIKEIKEGMAPKERLSQLEKFVYGGAVCVLLAVLGALISLVLK